MRLLLCEDEKTLSKVIKVLLTSNNYSVDTVFDGEEALDYIRTNIYDGIILDLMMPKINGIDVLKKIRSEGIKTPILILTAKAEIDDKVLGLDSGADDYLTKPFASKELVARIRALVRRGNTQLDSILKFHDLILDSSTLTLSSNSSSVNLSNKEFQIMEMLMANTNHVISNETFFDKIWGFDTEIEISIVWVYVSYLRKKIKELNSRVTIKVIRSARYRLDYTND